MFLYLKKYLIALVFIIILLLVLAYIVYIHSIPDNIILFNGSELILDTLAGIKIKQVNKDIEQQTLETSIRVEAISRNNRKKCTTRKKRSKICLHSSFSL